MKKALFIAIILTAGSWGVVNVSGVRQFHQQREKAQEPKGGPHCVPGDPTRPCPLN